MPDGICQLRANRPRKVTYVQKLCAVCGKKFWSDHRIKFCSPECRMTRKRERQNEWQKNYMATNPKARARRRRYKKRSDVMEKARIYARRYAREHEQQVRERRRKRTLLRRQLNPHFRAAPKPIFDRPCEQCGSRFYPNGSNSRSRFCSRNCFLAFNREHRAMDNCLMCGASFPKRSHGKKGQQKFCSRSCGVKFQRRLTGVFKMKTCGICKTKFVPGSGASRYCSDECRRKQSRISNREHRRKNLAKMRAYARVYFHRRMLNPVARIRARALQKIHRSLEHQIECILRGAAEIELAIQAQPQQPMEIAK